MFQKRKPNIFTIKFWVQSLFQGIIVVAPIGITIYVVWWIFFKIDSFLPDFLYSSFPSLFNNKSGIPRIPGLGFIVTLLLLVLVGWFSSIFFVNKAVAFIDKILEKTPGIKLIYGSVKDFLEAFGGKKKKFNRPVLVNVDGADVWRLGFITQSTATGLGMENHVVVYIPHSYAMSGITYLVPKDKIKLIGDNIKPADAMKFTVSGGVSDLVH